MSVYETKSDHALELEILESLSLAPASSSKSTLSSVSRTFKFILRDRKKIERLIKKLRDYNDSLNSMTSQLEQESSRRRLRARLPTDDPEKIRLLQAAAALLNHHDIEKMANARNVVEEGYTFEQSSCLQGQEDNFQVSSTDYLLHYDQLNFHGVPFSADQSRTIATFRGETVLVDWRCCRDVTWRRENPAAFQQRTENLARILNSDLRSLNLSVLHCVGYINQNSTVTGYAFRLPPDAHPGESPVSLHHLLTHVKVRLDIPGLDERFELAKALVSTIFEFHNMGWMHKNLQSKNILFWPKRGSSEVNLGKPYLVGFDTSRPNQPGEVTEKPYSTKEDDLYRHPNYKGPDAQSFQLPFDLYSLGVILFEIGLWESVSSQNGNRSRQGTRPSVHSSVSYSDPRYINLIMKGPVMDLKRHVGTRYRDAVMKCLDQSFDSVWDSAIGNKMEIFQDEVQNKVVDVIASCHA